jgi:hypothetical protein
MSDGQQAITPATKERILQKFVDYTEQLLNVRGLSNDEAALAREIRENVRAIVKGF